METTNTGIVHSPDATGTPKFIDDEIPESVTRPPTLIEEWNSGFLPFALEDETMNDESYEINEIATLKQV